MRARLVDGVAEFLGGGFAIPFPLFQRRLACFGDLAVEHKDVLGRRDDAGLEEFLDLLRAETIDVVGAAGNEVFQSLDGLRWTDQAAGAAAIDVFLAIA